MFPSSVNARRHINDKRNDYASHRFIILEYPIDSKREDFMLPKYTG